MQTAMMHGTSKSQPADQRRRSLGDTSLFVKRFALRGRDPAQADENLYRYCGNMPTEATDPRGLDIVLTVSFPTEFYGHSPVTNGPSSFIDIKATGLDPNSKYHFIQFLSFGIWYINGNGDLVRIAPSYSFFSVGGKSYRSDGTEYVDTIAPNDLKKGEYYDEISPASRSTPTSLEIADDPGNILDPRFPSFRQIMSWVPQSAGVEVSATRYFSTFLVKMNCPGKQPTIIMSYDWYSMETYTIGNLWNTHSVNYGPPIKNGTLDLGPVEFDSSQGSLLRKYDDWHDLDE